MYKDMKRYVLVVVITFLITLIGSFYLFFPLKKSVCMDGGTIEYSTPIYKIVIFNRLDGKNTVEFHLFKSREEIYQYP